MRKKKKKRNDICILMHEINIPLQMDNMSTCNPKELVRLVHDLPVHVSC